MDGITIRLPKEKVDLIREVYLQLEKETGLSTEEAFYNQMIIKDVNYLRRNLVNCWKAKEKSMPISSQALVKNTIEGSETIEKIGRLR